MEKFEVTNVLEPTIFLNGDSRLLLDTNVFMSTSPQHKGRLPKLLERCQDAIFDNANPIVIISKVTDELTKHTISDKITPAKREKSKKALTLIADATANRIFRNDLGDPTNPYADDTFVKIFKTFSSKYNMCLITYDTELRMRIRLVGSRTSHYVVAGTLNEDGLIVVESNQELYEKVNEKIWYLKQREADGTATPNDIRNLNSLTKCLNDFCASYSISPTAAKNTGQKRALLNSRPRTPGTSSPFSAHPQQKPPDSLLPDIAEIGEGDSVTFASKDGTPGVLQLGKFIGEGREGSVYEVISHPNWVVKIFNTEHRTSHRREKLELLVSKGYTFKEIGFPVSLVHNQKGDFAGYVMPRASGDVLSKSLMNPKRFIRNYPTWTKVDLVDVAISFLEKIAYLHSLNIIVGDINPKNIMVNDKRNVWLIDADSWQFEGYPCPVGFPQFTSPRIRGGYSDQLRTEQDEAFAIAVVLFMILMAGEHPYARKEADLSNFSALIREGKFPYQFRGIKHDHNQPDGFWRFLWSHLPFYVKEAFWHTFQKNGGERYDNMPSAQEWLGILRKYQLFLSSGRDFDTMSSQVFPTRYRKMAPDNPEGVCNECGASVISIHDKDQCSKRCGERHQPPSPDCYKPLPERCWDCSQKINSSRLCSDCGQAFITFAREEWYTNKGLFIPKSHSGVHDVCPESALLERQNVTNQRLRDTGRVIDHTRQHLNSVPATISHAPQTYTSTHIPPVGYQAPSTGRKANAVATGAIPSPSQTPVPLLAPPNISQKPVVTEQQHTSNRHNNQNPKKSIWKRVTSIFR